MQFENVYWDATLMQTQGNYPSILAIGDSWFWYPFPGGSLLNYLGGAWSQRANTWSSPTATTGLKPMTM